MKKMWLKIRQVFWGIMTDRAHRHYRRCRERLTRVMMELGEFIPPERREALRTEVRTLMQNLSEYPETTILEPGEEVDFPEGFWN